MIDDLSIFILHQIFRWNYVYVLFLLYKLTQPIEYIVNIKLDNKNIKKKHFFFIINNKL